MPYILFPVLNSLANAINSGQLYPNPVKPASLGGIEFDVLLEQEYILESDVPQFPVEEGFNISDNITLKPLTLTMVIQISNSPVTWSARFGGPRPGRINEVVNKLEELWRQKQPVTVVTNLKTYANMAIEKIAIPKNPEGGQALKIPIELRQINVVSIKTTNVPAQYSNGLGEAVARGGETKTAAGTAETQDASKTTEDKTVKSILSSLKDTAAGGIKSMFGGA